MSHEVLQRYLTGFTLQKADIMPDSPAIKDAEWQKFRLSLKGVSTEQKLSRIVRYIERRGETGLVEIQIMNYINALKRGGQLSKTGEVQR